MKKDMPVAASVDAYISQQPLPVQEVLIKLRSTIQKAAPQAEESISYGMPAFKLNGPLVYFGAFKNHCSFFPGNGSLAEEFADALINYTTAKGTIQFTVERPLPAALVTKMVKARVQQNLAKKKK